VADDDEERDQQDHGGGGDGKPESLPAGGVAWGGPGQEILPRRLVGDHAVGPLPQGRHDEGEYVESVEQIVPPSAASNLPMRRCTAPVKAPFSCPNSSEAMSGGGIAAQLTRMNARCARLDRL